MTDVLRGRPRPTPPGPAARSPSVVLHGVLAALAAALSGLAVLTAVVLVAWVADARSGSSGTGAVRAAADGWLLAHGGGLCLPSGRVAGVPLGLTVLAAVVLHRAGASLAQAVEVSGLRAAARATAVLAVTYGLAAAAVARIAATGTVASSAVLAGAGGTLLAALTGGLGVIRAADLSAALRAALPARVPALVRAAGVAVLGLLGAGLVLVLVSLAVHAGRAGQLAAALEPGLVGGGMLVVGCVLLLPNAALWAVAYAAGPGFAVGAGTGVTPFAAVLGPVPSFPLLAALPQDGSPPPAVRAVLLLPVLAGVAAGAVLVRSLPPEPADGGGAAHRMLRLAGGGLVAGLAAAGALGLLAAVAGGRLGDGYLAAVGPSPWRVLVALALEIGVPAAITVAVWPPREPTPPGRKPTPAAKPSSAHRRPKPGGGKPARADGTASRQHARVAAGGEAAAHDGVAGAADVRAGAGEGTAAARDPEPAGEPGEKSG